MANNHIITSIPAEAPGKRIAIIGGSFDPPHIAHKAIIQHMMESPSIDTVIVVPTNSNPLKQEAPESSVQDRLAMVKLMLDDIKLTKDIIVLDHELKAEKPSFTIDTVELIKSHASWSKLEYNLVLGTDVALDIERWKRKKVLAELVKVVLVPRGSFETTRAMQVLMNNGFKVRIEQILPPNVKAREIRENIKHGVYNSQQMCEPVFQYINMRNLYNGTRTRPIAAPQPVAEILATKSKYSTHCLAVTLRALELAERHSPELAEKAQLAGWLHDVAKVYSKAEITAIINQNNIEIPFENKTEASLWHAPVAAWMAEHLWNLGTPDVWDAVCWHTTGKADLSLLGQILIAADATSYDRIIPEVDFLRQEVDENLQVGLYKIMKWKEQYIWAKGRMPVRATTDFINSLEAVITSNV